MRPDDALRGLFEKAPHAAAVACFPDEARDLEGMIREVLAAAKLQITPGSEGDADGSPRRRPRPVARRGREARALCPGKGTIEESDVETAVGDAAELALDRIVMAAASGRAAAAVNECDRSIAGGEDAADRDPGPAAAFPAAAPHAQRARRRTDHGRRVAPAASRPALQAEGRLRAAVPRLDPAQAQRWHWPRSPTPPSARNSALDSVLAEHLLLDLGGWQRRWLATTVDRFHPGIRASEYAGPRAIGCILRRPGSRL